MKEDKDLFNKADELEKPNYNQNEISGRAMLILFVLFLLALGLFGYGIIGHLKAINVIDTSSTAVVTDYIDQDCGEETKSVIEEVI
jgi:hypothetical protein